VSRVDIFTLLIILIKNPSIRHRDWYIDQGPAGPLTGVIASVSDAVGKTWASTSTYAKSISATMHKEPVPKESRPPSQEQRDNPPVRGILAGQTIPNPVQEALTYPPEHLEWLAYSMASERLPDVKNRSKHRKMHTWSPRMQMTSVLKPSPGYRHEPEHPHGKAHEITHETGQFAYAVMRTGFHGMCILRWSRLFDSC
jgi:sterol 3beta-glucosyltransferase